MMSKLKKATFAIVAVFTMGGGLLSLPPKEVSARTTYVWIAPNHGKRYHYSKGCRGLNNAGRKSHVSLRWAKHHGYKLCGWEH